MRILAKPVGGAYGCREQVKRGQGAIDCGAIAFINESNIPYYSRSPVNFADGAV